MTDAYALIGAHTIGRVHHTLYGQVNGGKSQTKLVSTWDDTPLVFDNRVSRFHLLSFFFLLSFLLSYFLSSTLCSSLPFSLHRFFPSSLPWSLCPSDPSFRLPSLSSSFLPSSFLLRSLLISFLVFPAFYRFLQHHPFAL